MWGEEYEKRHFGGCQSIAFTKDGKTSIFWIRTTLIRKLTLESEEKAVLKEFIKLQEYKNEKH